MENAIEVRDVSVRFRRYYDRKYTLKDRILFRGENGYEEETVLDRISFDVKKGETLGLIGSNGCGKSTTLKLLAGILCPDEGTVRTEGRVSGLLELGAGFHPDLTGRENIYINASVFGLSRREIRRRIGDIIAFSELGEKIDSPVRTYSSGMYMRLAFSIAVNVDADILLIDEILAVGDVRFQKKCYRKLMDIRQSGVTILLVSHALEETEKICDRNIWISNGEIRAEGRPDEVNRQYLDDMLSGQVPEKRGEDGEEEPITLPEPSEDMIHLNRVRITDHEENENTVFVTGNDLNLEIALVTFEPLCHYNIEINLVSQEGVFCSGISMAEDSLACGRWEGEKEIRLQFPRLCLLRGQYHFDLHITGENGESVFFKGNVAAFTVESLRGERGLFTMPHRWDLEAGAKDVSD